MLYLAVGSVMGTADALAVDIEAFCAAHGITTQRIERIAATALTPADALLICSSTTGMGELPANIAPLYRQLTEEPPNISGVPGAVIALGDSHYPNFSAAGRRLHQVLTDIGASASLLVEVDAAQTDEPWALVKPALEQWLRQWQIST